MGKNGSPVSESFLDTKKKQRMADGLLLKRRVFELDRSVLASENA